MWVKYIFEMFNLITRYVTVKMYIIDQGHVEFSWRKCFTMLHWLTFLCCCGGFHFSVSGSFQIFNFCASGM